jgi:hypothetical protein
LLCSGHCTSLRGTHAPGGVCQALWRCCRCASCLVMHWVQLASSYLQRGGYMQQVSKLVRQHPCMLVDSKGTCRKHSSTQC